MRTYGSISLSPDQSQWTIGRAEPHVSIRLKQLFPSIPKAAVPPYRPMSLKISISTSFHGSAVERTAARLRLAYSAESKISGKNALSSGVSNEAEPRGSSVPGSAWDEAGDIK